MRRVDRALGRAMDMCLNALTVIVGAFVLALIAVVGTLATVELIQHALSLLETRCST